MFEPISILIAEDELPTRRGIHRTLEMWAQGAHRLHAVENGTDALAYASEHPVDLLITDIRMPGLNGLELLERLKHEESELTSILLTGYAEFEYARKALQLGAINYILKPVEQEALVKAVEEACLHMSKMKRARQTADHKSLSSRELNDAVPTLPEVKNESIRQALRFIAREWNSPALSMKEVAEHIHLNASYASVLFKEETKLTFTDYITGLRLRQAKKLLLQTDSRIYEIAEQVGFAASKYFVRVFRETEGMTPREFRVQFKLGDGGSAEEAADT
ncbi:response regulator transcription factor [Paenibacillus thalictri]|uniref:Response regulator n=1 Tax=Paenibacillus thalictri TaxID=2527873 RepID=A0A4V6MSG0_9BACL|nr:response regulator [Paenibacillus thalictri]TBL76615.1 response regulator [Paenibacillus thalictri]